MNAVRYPFALSFGLLLTGMVGPAGCKGVCYQIDGKCWWAAEDSVDQGESSSDATPATEATTTQPTTGPLATGTSEVATGSGSTGSDTTGYLEATTAGPEVSTTSGGPTTENTSTGDTTGDDDAATGETSCESESDVSDEPGSAKKVETGCDSEAEIVSVLHGGSDIDWFTYDAKCSLWVWLWVWVWWVWDTVPLEMHHKIENGGDLDMCVVATCDNDSTPAVECLGTSTNYVVDSEWKGCCNKGNVDYKILCDKNLGGEAVSVRISLGGAIKCTDYVISVNYKPWPL